MILKTNVSFIRAYLPGDQKIIFTPKETHLSNHQDISKIAINLTIDVSLYRVIL